MTQPRTTRSARHHAPGSTGDVLTILRDGRPRTKRELSDLTGVARTTIAQRLSDLENAGLVREFESPRATGGRPSAAYQLDSAASVVLAVDLGASHATIAATDLLGNVLSHVTQQTCISDGPSAVMALIFDRIDLLRSDPAIERLPVRGIGIGLPGPVDQNTGRPTSPPLMVGWDGFDVHGALQARYSCPVYVDNDANILALGEQTHAWPEIQDLIFVKIATGVGTGIISGGRLLHGSQGSAGDLGHVYSPAAQDRPCRCGNRSCLESLASAASIAATLTSKGHPATSAADVVALVRSGNIESVRALREAGRALGDVLAMCTALLNPQVIVIGGEITNVGEPLLAGVRESIYARALPLASRNLKVAVARSGRLGGVIGAARMAIENVFADLGDTTADALGTSGLKPLQARSR